MTNDLFRRPLFGFSGYRWLLLLWELSVLNVVFRLSSDNYYAAGYWFAFSLALGLLWLGQKFQRPALRYLAVGGIATALFVLGLEVGKRWQTRPAHRAPADHLRPTTK